ncbi:MAG: 16S rRNA (uracil(1498)-N(3))-methyltransferase [Clostridia bacterium]|nr:16S rRNA (uracil(1498)-N(3))-methyltransferase [Clostridia bacterium]
MPRFFIRQNQISEENGERIVTISGDDAHHISRSLRMASGEKIEVVDMQKNLYTCELFGFYDGYVTSKIISQDKADTEPPHYIKLYQALSKGDKMEIIIQKSIECGACEIIPFSSERCVVKLDKKDEQKKIDRWQKIAEGAAKQSGRGAIPQVKGVLTFKELLDKLEGTVLFCYEGEDTKTIKQALKEIKIQGDVSVIIGSEGGFSKKEAELLKEAGAICVGLGKRILRCETAPIFALSCIAYELEL